ncbi:MAG: zinc transporter [Candidatus Aureabacteria bacterium]|nr:zinc transporter [Candidatus Auribacterota bacterium]
MAGLATGIGALPIFFIRKVSDKFLDASLGFDAGAMLFVISEEIIPETHSRGNDREATVGVIVGFIIMMVLDNVFG